MYRWMALILISIPAQAQFFPQLGHPAYDPRFMTGHARTDQLRDEAIQRQKEEDRKKKTQGKEEIEIYYAALQGSIGGCSITEELVGQDLEVWTWDSGKQVSFFRLKNVRPQDLSVEARKFDPRWKEFYKRVVSDRFLDLIAAGC